MNLPFEKCVCLSVCLSVWAPPPTLESPRSSTRPMRQMSGMHPHAPNPESDNQHGVGVSDPFLPGPCRCIEFQVRAGRHSKPVARICVTDFFSTSLSCPSPPCFAS
ncbi:hypothetical protein B0T19DRAFT_407172 [Cercophora scortea]|uniref:Uncharacterized protein n=1 Tax=Cercophora scortea TaxID=314031 RepID=A0AAE0MLQ9_9PEZI|nr:hypothetical protein B0T19DRAFT_407172 [Cercophora scortea]